MTFINRGTETPGTIGYLYRQKIEALVEALTDPQRHCVFFLGAGASIDENAPVDLPTGVELSKKMAQEIGLDWHKAVPLSTIAFYYEFLRDRQQLVRMLEREIGNRQIAPSRTIQLLVEIIGILEQRSVHSAALLGEQRMVVITTNYDRQFETAYREILQREPGVLIYQGAKDPNRIGVPLNRDLRGELKSVPALWLPSKPTTLFKMHGCISQPDDQGLVITEEDYINFLTNALGPIDEYKKLPPAIMSRVAAGTIIFVGYSMEDWNFRTIFKATVEAHTAPGKSYAVQFWNLAGEDDAQSTRREALTQFWGRKGVDILNVKADQFMQDLLKSIRVRVQSESEVKNERSYGAGAG